MPERTLFRLIYFSRQHLPSDRTVDEVVGDVIRASIRNNRAVSVTGLLLLHQGWFVQALEGPAQAVTTTYHRILQDPRHREAELIGSQAAQTREFADWNMCARSLTPADDAILDTLGQRRFDPYKLTPVAALKLLQAVRAIQGETTLAALG